MIDILILETLILILIILPTIYVGYMAAEFSQIQTETYKLRSYLNRVGSLLMSGEITNQEHSDRWDLIDVEIRNLQYRLNYSMFRPWIKVVRIEYDREGK